MRTRRDPTPQKTKPEHAPTDDQRLMVETFAAFGVPQEEIAIVLKIAPKTLRKHYGEELDTGAIKAGVKVAQSLFKQAIDGNTAAAIFFLKARCGWRETTNVHHSGNIQATPEEERATRVLELFDAARARRDRSAS